MCKFNDDSFQTPVDDAPDMSDDVPEASDGLAEDTVAPQLSQPQDDERTIMEINSLSYEIGDQLGEGGFGTVYAATCLEDDRQVAVKFASSEYAKYVHIDGYSRPVPLEVALQMFANQGPRVPQIIELLDWKDEDEDDYYIMVLERPMPCQSLHDYLRNYTGTIDEDLARIIMGEVAFAAQICCQRGVFHRDIKLENLLINPGTLEVKLIDFGCGDFLTSAGYTSFAGTEEYRPPEYEMYGVYHGEPATVWSLGILLFVILFWEYPSRRDLRMISKNVWKKEGLSEECCDFILCCLQRSPRKRIELQKVSLHDWFKMADVENNNRTIMGQSNTINLTYNTET
ncbi:serine/threonine-protein kinase pim-2-like [Ctenopharyngodon idella]|uniref:serine/threonine-protein kinase pim-2-like n=1 Tax=Ctenopharyngodon idella TaxID=7959 RepID=UPI002231D925|nr:serine/threonine-protein kinase pim-2-like [Ctenopharyngodon idella]